MSETTLRVKTQADIAALKEYRKELVAFTTAVRDAGQAMREAGGLGTDGPPGGSSPAPPGYGPGSGAPMPSPTAPAPAPNAPGGAPAPAPTAAPPSAAQPPPTAPPVGPPNAPAGRQAAGGQEGRNYRAEINERGGAYLTNMGAAAVSIGLGASAMGFLLNSGQKYFELSKIIAHVGARFREAESNVIGFGSAMGYTVAETAGLVEQLGNVRDSFSKSEFLRNTGFARTMGMDPGAALGSFGKLSGMQGSAITSRQMAEIAGRAQWAGMSQGRMGEFLGMVQRMGESQFGATGQFNFRDTMTAGALPGMVFGMNDPRAKGETGIGLTEGLNSVLTGNPAMQTFMMRAMGFGSAGGPGYIEMRKRMEAGVYDPRNIRDLFKAFRARGMGKGAMFRSLESVSGGSLKSWQIEGLVNSLGSEEGMIGLEGEMGGGMGDMAASRYTGNASGNADWVSSGRHRISMGEGRALQMEGMQMKVGDTVAQVMVDMTDVLINLVKTGNNLLGMDFEGMIKDLSGSIKRASEAIESASRPGADFRRTYLEAPANIASEGWEAAQDFWADPNPTIGGRKRRATGFSFDPTAPADNPSWNGGGGQSP